MVKNKLWRFGDSYSKTEDRDFGDIELNHSVYISEHFNMELVHLGDGGMSNLEIFQRILSNNQNYREGDMILINFADTSRTALVENHKIISTANGDNMSSYSKNLENIIINDLQYSISDIIFYLVKPFLESLIGNGIKVYHFYNGYEIYPGKIKNELTFLRDTEPIGYQNWIFEKGWEDLTPTGNLHYVVGKQRDISEIIINKIEEIDSNEK